MECRSRYLTWLWWLGPCRFSGKEPTCWRRPKFCSCWVPMILGFYFYVCGRLRYRQIWRIEHRGQQPWLQQEWILFRVLLCDYIWWFGIWRQVWGLKVVWVKVKQPWLFWRLIFCVFFGTDWARLWRFSASAFWNGCWESRCYVLPSQINQFIYLIIVFFI